MARLPRSFCVSILIVVTASSSHTAVIHGSGEQSIIQTARAVGAFLTPEGRFDLEAARKSGYQGPVDLRGFAAAIDPVTQNLLVCSPASSGATADPDDVYWDNSISPSTPGVGDVVLSSVVYDGDLIAGGWFTTAGGVAANHIARWDGSTWQPLGSGMDYEVYSLSVYDGDLIAAGYFTTAGGATAKNIARWDGSTWQALSSGMNGAVHSLTVYDGDLIAGGDFDSAGGVAANHIARWDGSTWEPLESGLIGYVLSLTVYEGDLIAGGRFDTAGGLAANNIARWDGSTWEPLGAGVSGVAYSLVSSLTVYNGDLIAGGDFDTAGGTPASNIAHWDGSSWQPLGSEMNGVVRFLTVYEGDLIAAVGFMGGGLANDIARWDGSTWELLGSVGSELHFFPDVFCLTVYDGDLIAGGDFTHVSDDRVSYIARWDGTIWQPLSSGINGSVLSLTVYDGDLIAGGSFTSAGGVPAGKIARWNGTSWESLGSGMNGYVRILTVYEGDLIAGGDFDSAGGVAASHIARWDGSTWQPLGSGMNGDVLSLIVYDNKLIAGGEFQFAGGAVALRIAAWDGSVWAPLGAGIGRGFGDCTGPCPWVAVAALAVYDNQLIAGGAFDQTGNIAAWDGNGWSPLGSGLNQWALALTVYDNKLIAYGARPMGWGFYQTSIATWDGSAWSTLESGASHLGYGGYALTVYDGSLTVGGYFSTAGGVGANNIAAWDGNGWSPLGSGTNSYVQALTVYEGELIVGGTFTSAGGKVAAYLSGWTSKPLNVSLDIHPGQCPNWISTLSELPPRQTTPPVVKCEDLEINENTPRPSRVREHVEVAVLGGTELDVYDLDPLSIWLESVSPINFHFADMSSPPPLHEKPCDCELMAPDGITDLVLLYDKEELLTAIGSQPDGATVALRVNGYEKSGRPIEGSDCLTIGSVQLTSSIGEQETISSRVTLSNYPNPFNAATVIAYTLETDGPVTLEVFNVLGQRVSTLVDEFQSAGEHHIDWDASDQRGRRISSGVYFYRLTVGDRVLSKTMVLLH